MRGPKTCRSAAFTPSIQLQTSNEEDHGQSKCIRLYAPLVARSEAGVSVVSSRRSKGPLPAGRPGPGTGPAAFDPYPARLVSTGDPKAQRSLYRIRVRLSGIWLVGNHSGRRLSGAGNESACR